MEQACKTTVTEEDTLNRSAFVDARGNEVQITEQMIQQACKALAEQLPNHHAIAAENSWG